MVKVAVVAEESSVKTDWPAAGVRPGASVAVAEAPGRAAFPPYTQIA
jgi:hypothetical protein